MTHYVYRPSCGAEGGDFMAKFCNRCERDREFREHETNPCLIASRALAFEEDDEHYPAEWTHDADGRPTCTAFVLAPDATSDPHTTERTAPCRSQD